MFEFVKKTAKDIKEIKIQGAESIAIESVKTIRHLILASREKTKHKFLDEIKKAIEHIQKTRPTEPCLTNSLYYIFKDVDEIEPGETEFKKTKELLLKNCSEIFKHFRDGNKIIESLGSQKIKKNMVIYTHCHSSNVVRVLKKSKQLGTKFFVFNTETRPLYQGRLTAHEFSKLGIEVEHYVDSAARLILKRADLMLIGCDAITKDKIYNKMGSGLFAETAKKYKVPVYICTDSWKFSRDALLRNPVIVENRPKREIWGDAPKGVNVVNPAFEDVPNEFITGIISELGILTPKEFSKEVVKRYPYLFKI